MTEADKKVFKQNVKNALSKKEKRGSVFSVGTPHPVFVQKGIPNQPLHISPAIIRKAKKSKYNNHSVSDADLERLPELLDNPTALLKSLTVQNCFVVVLDTQDDHGLPVIASIKPEIGFNEITSVYGRENFDVFIQRTYEAGAILSVNKKKATEEVWAPIQSRGETIIDDYQIVLSQKNPNTSSANIKNQTMKNPIEKTPDTLDDFVQAAGFSSRKEVRLNEETRKKFLSAGMPVEDTLRKLDFSNMKQYKGQDILVFEQGKGVGGRPTLDRNIYSIVKNPIYKDGSGGGYIIKRMTENHLTGKKMVIQSFRSKDINETVHILREKLNASWGIAKISSFDYYNYLSDEPRIRYENDIPLAPNKSIEPKTIHQDARPVIRAKEHIMANENSSSVLSPEEAREFILQQIEEANKQFDAERKTLSEERAFLNALQQRKVVAEALKAGTLSCLPGADGYADTSPAVNVANGTRYHGANLLQLKEHQKANGFPTAEYVTKEAQQNAVLETNDDGFRLKDWKKQHPIEISFSSKNASGQFENKTVQLYNIAQLQNPEKMRAWGAEQISEKISEKQEYLAQRYGISNQQKGRENLPAPEVSPKSAEPEKYLGAYLAAVSMGGKFKPSPETAAEFGKNFKAALFQKGANGHTNPFALPKICNAAADHCKETIKQTRQAQRQEVSQQQTQKQTQNKGRGM